VTRVALGCVALLFSSIVAGCQADPPSPEIEPTGTPLEPVALTFMVYGAPEEVAAYESMVRTFNDLAESISVNLVTVANHNQARAQLRSGDTPDVFLMPRRDLAEVADARLNQPLDELLDSRGVDFSDAYKRDALQAFSYDNALQCMPYGVSPMVIYYNTNLIDFETIEERGGAAPSSHESWTFDEFVAAAEFATRRTTKGLHIEPSLLGLAPFVYSGGGELFDDRIDPTRLTLSDEGSREALERSMQLIREDRLTLTPRQVRQQSALERFKTGKLGMIAGFRDLVPELRETPSLSFDVMPMPTLDTETTVGDVTGLCLAAEPASTSAAADFIVHAISAESVSQVAEAGYLVPANNQVAESDAFLQPDRLPAHPEVFNRVIRAIVETPVIDTFSELETVVQPLIYQLFYARLIDIEALTEQIDEASGAVIAPETLESESPSPTPTP
jgi:multiple sugar transport system substrate-binding protein